MKKFFFLNLVLIIIIGHPVGNSCPPNDELKEIPNDDYTQFYPGESEWIQGFGQMPVEIDNPLRQYDPRIPAQNLPKRQIPQTQTHGTFPDTETVSPLDAQSQITSVKQTETRTMPTPQHVNIQIRQHRVPLSEMLANILELLSEDTHEPCPPQP